MGLTAFKQVKNNAKTTATANSINNTTLTPFTVATGTGTLFPSVGSFWVTVWNAPTYNTPGDDPLREVMLVTRSGDTFTPVARGQLGQGSPAGIVLHPGAPAVQQLIEDQHLTDIYTAIGTLEAQSFNVQNPVYGAKGDGTTDDTAAIQAALNAANTAGAGIVLLPPATVSYKVSGELIVYPNTFIVGSKKAGLIDASAWTGFSGVKSVFKSLQTAGKTDMYLRDVAMKGFFTHGTAGVFAQTPALLGINLNNTRRISVEGCYFEGFFDATTMGNATTTYDDTVGPNNAKEIQYRNNYCYRCVGGLQGQSQEGTSWIGNNFYQIADDCCAYLTTQGAGGAQKAICQGNIFEDGRYLNNNAVPGVGVLLKADGSGVVGAVTDIIVADNVSRNSYSSIYIAGISNMNIDNNLSDTSYISGIYILGSYKQLKISNNKLLNSNTGASGSHANILAAGGAGNGDIEVINNDIYGSNLAAEQGITIQGNPTNVRIGLNKISNVGGNHIYVNALNVMAFKNHSVGSTNAGSFVLIDSCTGLVETVNNTGTGISASGGVIRVNNAINLDLIGNRYDSAKYGINIQNGSTNPVTRLRVAGNTLPGMTGSTSDGEVGINVVLNSTAANGTVELSGNHVTDGDNTKYLGISISGNGGGGIGTLKVMNNTSRNNKYGYAINFSPGGTITNYYYNDNDFTGNASYQVSETSVTYTNKNVGIFSVNGTITGIFSGPLTGNVTGNLTGSVTGNVTGNVSGTALNVTGIVAFANGGTGATTQQTAINATNPHTTLGDLSYRDASNVSRLAGNITTAKQFLTQTGTGAASAAPIWATIAVADVPTLNQNTTGTAANVTGVVGISNGGTGSSTQNFVDLTTAQTIAGVKTLSNNTIHNANVGIGLTPVANLDILNAAAATPALNVVWKGDATNSAYGVKIFNSGSAAFTGDGAVLNISVINGSDTGRAMSINHSGTNLNSTALIVNKFGTGAGRAMDIANSGTGQALNITNSSTGAGATIAGSVGINQLSPDASAALDVVSTTKGVLLPRMTTTQVNAISTPAEGLMVYDLTLHVPKVYNGTAWKTYTVT